MIKLTLNAGKERTNILGVPFKNGEATLPDNLKKKADAICRFYNVEMTIEGPEPVGETSEDETAENETSDDETAENETSEDDADPFNEDGE